MADTRGEASANPDLVEGIARAIYEQRPSVATASKISALSAGHTGFALWRHVPPNPIRSESP
jgi:hypothetical protein